MVSTFYFYLILLTIFYTRLYDFKLLMKILSKHLQLQVTILNIKKIQLYDITYSYLILIIFKKIYLTHRWDPIRYSQSK